MPYDPGLAQRLEDFLEDKKGFQQKKMFGGIGWLLNGNMCVGVYKDWLIIRVGEEKAASIFKKKHVKPMDITGKPMKGWAMVAPKGYESDSDLAGFVDLATGFVKKLPPK
ncbi:MAG TPA: RNA methyltransferase [Rhodospirillaceae bacterium]|nr:RNA methyltransferase [Rhodospirillaceae bacterium]